MRTPRLAALTLVVAVVGTLAAAPAAVPADPAVREVDAIDEVDDAEEAPEQFVTGISDQAEHPDRPMLTLSQTIYGGSAADAFRQRWEEQGRGVKVEFEYPNRYGARIQGNVWGATW